MRVLTTTGAGVALAMSALAWPAEGDRPRARDLGIAPGVFEAGPLDAITDVKGVRVGQVTLIGGERVRTGVTAIVPHEGNVFRDKVPAGIFVYPSARSNGFRTSMGAAARMRWVPRRSHATCGGVGREAGTLAD